jgi:endogenous inhibitor of DNA gyrase (YacG/DUF329 family)
VKGAKVALSSTPCAKCGKPIPILAKEHGDAFCSRLCAETHYGTLQSNHHSGREIFGTVAKEDEGMPTMRKSQGESGVGTA